MFATKKEAEHWIDRYATKVLFVPRKIGRGWRVVPLAPPLSEDEIHRMEEKRESKERAQCQTK